MKGKIKYNFLMNRSNKPNNYFWVGGKNTCLEILKEQSREIKEILCTKNFIDKNKLHNKDYKVVTNEQINKLFSKSFNHQGIALRVGKITTSSSKNLVFKNKEKITLVAIDDVTDQGNIGSIVRTCLAFNADGIIINKKYFNQDSFIFMKAAAGASEKLKIITTSNIYNDLKFLKKNNFWVYGMSSKAKDVFHKQKFMNKRVLIFGSESKGIKETILKQCDLILKLDISNKIESLNVSNAVSASLHGLKILDQF